MIPNKGVYANQGSWRGYIPFVEAWYPDRIPFSYITSIFCSHYNHSEKNIDFFKFDVSDIDNLGKELEKIISRWIRPIA